MEELDRAETKALLLGTPLGNVYNATANDLITDMLDALDDQNVTEAEWDQLTSRGNALFRALKKSSEADLEVPASRKTWLRFRKAKSYENSGNRSGAMNGGIPITPGLSSGTHTWGWPPHR